MEESEVTVAHEKRKEDAYRVPKLNRQEVIDIVREACHTIDQSSITLSTRRLVPRAPASALQYVSLMWRWVVSRVPSLK